MGIDRKEALQLVVRNCGENMIVERPTGHWWYTQVSVPGRQRFLMRMLAPQGLCGILINALKLLAYQQKDGDSSIQSIVIVTGLCERSRIGTVEA